MRSARTIVVGLGLCLGTPAQSPEEALFERLTLEQKVGQLFMTWTLSRVDDGYEQKQRTLDWIRSVGLGGVILSLGEARDAAALIAELRAASEIPLWFAGDFEAGVAFRLEGATELGSNMLIGAAGLGRLARAAGRVTAAEGKALGFHWAFAPVLDVNSNPHNPIINVRSFGEDPALVARLGAAWIAGAQDHGMLATGKHFPGHGDVASDSHLVMPTVPGDRARLDRVELAPFRVAIDAGLGSIMTGHLSVPGLGEDPAVPATLSPTILDELLRRELGFDGLVVTDALDMGGVREKIAPTDAAVRALAAGADVLLMPPDPVAARDAVVAAVREGRVPPARLDQAVRRILQAKARLGALAAGPTAGVDALRTPEHLAVADEIAARGLTLVRDRHGLVPLPAAERRVLVTLLDQDDVAAGTRFAAALGIETTHRLHPKSDAAAFAAAVADLAAADLAVAAIHVRVRSYSGRIGIPPALAPVTEALARAKRCVVVSFGNPYLVRDLPGEPSYLCAYSATEHTERAAARALRGEAAVTGRVPVGIPDVCAAGAGLTFLPGTDLERVAPEREGIAADIDARLRDLLERALAARAFPGAVAMVSRRGRIVAEVAVGRETYDAEAPRIRADSVFDLASLTKVCATTPVVLRLVAQGRLGLDQKVRELVPEFAGVGKERVTVRHLLTHSAGLPAYERYFKTMAGKDAIVSAAAREGLMTEPGESAVYSDLGLILLMACCEKATGTPFDQLVGAEVTGPLGMRHARFALTGAPLDAVPTEDCAFRGRVVRGEVHDENAFAMGGVSGHAGLFATAEDVTRIGVAFLGGGRGYLPAPLARQAVVQADVVAGSSRALGWDTFVQGGAGGTRLSPGSFGHTGFTGTSIWCDPARDLTIVLLTNRVHPTRVNAKIAKVRRELADLVVGAVE